MAKIYLDTETCGLHGVPVLLQWAVDEGSVDLWDIWKQPIGETLDLIEYIASQDVIGFNLAFDWFHLCKIYTMFYLYVLRGGSRDDYPDNHIDELAMLEAEARFLDVCIKPARAHDIMLYARKTKYQSLMDRDDIKINRVPTQLAWHLAKELERKIPFDDIYFARQKDKSLPRWRVYDIERPDGTINPDFKTIKLSFRASSALKNLYRHAFRVKEPFYLYSDIELGRDHWPEEVGYAPFAAAIAPDPPRRWGKTWPFHLNAHLAHWYYNEPARTYALNDVVYTRRLYLEEFKAPEPGDVDSTLACMVASCRWHGYAIDIPEITELKYQALRKLGFNESAAQVFKSRPVSKEAVIKHGSTLMAPAPAKKYLLDAMDADERLGFQGSTKKTVLEAIVNDQIWRNEDGSRSIIQCRAQEILDARTSKKEIEVYDKLLRARRFHASFKVIGTLSSRMAGDNGLNAQGIKHTKNVRRAFPLADRDIELLAMAMGITPVEVETRIKRNELALARLCGGDFKSFEVSLAAKVFDDRKLDEALMSGKKIHALFGMELFPGNTYEQICATEGQDPDLYDKGKKGIFSMFYGGETHTLVTRLGVAEEAAMRAFEGIGRRFPGIRIFGDRIKSDFGALSQPRGIGTKVEWSQPKDYVESFLGFRRYFSLENRVMKALFELAQDVPKEWRDIKIKVQRRERIQTPAGAVSSALYGAAFGIQSRNIRAAKNHTIQSPGAEITKATQANIWSIQPSGVSQWLVQPMNVHDEIMTPTREGYQDQVKEKAAESVRFYKKMVPLLAIDWFSNVLNWAGKKGEESTVKAA